MRKILAPIAALALSTSVAAAGSLTPPVEPIVTPPAPVMPVTYDWTGGYGGLSLSYGRATHNTTTAPDFWPNGSGFGIGAVAGYNWQMGSTVFGLEGHISANRMRGTTTTGVGRVDTDLSTLASLRARLGVASDRTLFFVSAGPAAGRVNHNAVDAGLSESQNVTGFMVGVGFEQAMASGWNLRGDLEHYRFGSRDFSTAGPGSFPGVETRANVARISAVFRF